MQDIKASIAVLCGGRSKRFGTDKFSHRIGNKTILEMVIEKFISRSDNVFLQISGDLNLNKSCFNDHQNLAENVDIIKDKGPLGAIYSAIKFAKYDRVFVVAGDLPFIDEQIFYELLKYHTAHLVVPCWASGFFEPLCAMYSKEVLAVIRDQLEVGDLKISNVYTRMDENHSGKFKIIYLNIDELINKNIINSECFKNINTFQDLI